MAKAAVDGTWSQKLTRVGGCDEFKLHHVTYKGTDGQPKDWHGVHLTSRAGQEVDDYACEERVVCVVKGHVRHQQEPFILLLATYKPALNRTCLTLPCGWVRRSQHTDWNKAVSKILFDSTGEKVHVMSTIATAKAIGCPHLAPERVKMVTAEVGRDGLWSTLPPCGFQSGPRSSISPSNAIFTPVHAGGHTPSAHRLCFLPMSDARAALAALRGSFDEVDAEVELLVHALSVQAAAPPAPERGLPSIYLVGLGFLAGIALCAASHRDSRGRG